MTEQPFLATGLALLLVIDLLTCAARAAFLQTSHARLLALREQMERQVSRTVLILPVMPRLRASFNLTLVVTRFLLAGGVMYIVSRQNLLLPPVLVSLIALLLAAFVLFWVEWGVDRLILRNPERWALRLTSFVQVLLAVQTVFLTVPFAFAREGQVASEVTGTVTEDELKTLVDAGQEEGVLEQGERRMIYSIFQLGDTLAREIMVPRIDMLALDANTPLDGAIDALLQSGHSRVPVYEETVDKTLGILYVKDLLRVVRDGNEIDSLRPLLRPAYFVPEAKKADELLAEMQSQRIHIAVVVDEYGGVAGLVTLEDIVEEILGEIRDEYDQGEELPFQALKDGEYLFLGRVDMDDFNEIMKSELPNDEADTLGGYIYSRLGRVPDVGETIQKDNLLLTVEQVSARRIHKVRARWLQPATEGGEDKENVDG